MSARRRSEWAAKRIVEWIAAVALLLITAPLQALIAILIKLDSPGPAVFTQTRVGLNGRRFGMHKFRTLRWTPGTPPVLNPDGSTRVDAHDERLTRVGRWLRSGWDELPQLWNVLKGEMALIGPRPDQPFHLQLYPEEERRRLSVRPGITGLPQISGRNDISWAQRRQLDLFYIDHYSLWLDVRIALKTCRAFLQRDEAFTWGTGITR